MELVNREKAATMIVELGTAARNVQATIELIGCSALAHMRDHGDYRTAVQLMNALPNGQRVQALAVWFREFSSNKFTVSFDNKVGQWVGKLKKERTAEDFRVEEAMETSYADFTKERTNRTMGVTQLLSYLKRVANNTDNNPDGTPKVDAATRALASKLYGTTSNAVALAAEAV